MKTAMLALACLVAANTARAQDPRLRGALDPETLAKVTRLVDSARVESLPVDPLIGLALEGAQKHADGARITKAVQRYLGALRAARAALGPDATPAELTSGAGVLLSGVSSDVLRQLRAATQSDRSRFRSSSLPTSSRAACRRTRRRARLPRPLAPTRVTRTIWRCGASSSRTSSPARRRRRRRCFACAPSPACHRRTSLCGRKHS